MKIDQLKEKINQIMFSDDPYGLTLFACIKGEDRIVLKKIQITDVLRDSISGLLSNTVRANYLSEDAELEPADNISDNKKVFYEIEQTDLYKPFSFLKGYQNTTEKYSEKDQDALMGVLFAINRNDSVIWFYQNVYAVNLIKRSRAVYAIFQKGSTYTTLDKEIVKIESRIDIAVIDDSIITAKIDLLQKSFGFNEYVRREARNTIAQIASMHLLCDTAKFEALISGEKLTNAKKLMKVKHSPVLRMDKNELIQRLKTHPRYQDKFKYDGDMLIIKTQKDASEFIKMLNDDIVKSELTNQEYDSSSKQMLEPLSA